MPGGDDAVFNKSTAVEAEIRLDRHLGHVTRFARDQISKDVAPKVWRKRICVVSQVFQCPAAIAPTSSKLSEASEKVILTAITASVPSGPAISPV